MDAQSNPETGIDPLFSLDGRVIAVTGGAGRLGSRMCRALHERGARVAVLDTLDEGGIAERFGDLERHTRLLPVSVDVTDRVSLETGLRRIEDGWETPAGLINAAAIDSPPDAPPEENGPFETYPRESFDKILSVNVTGVMLCCQVMGGAMARAGRGSIVNIASTYGLVAPDQGLYEYRRQAGEEFYKPVAYSASKSAIFNLTRYLATYWGRNGVRVNTLTPGGVFAGQDENFLDGYNRRVPMGRMAREDELEGPAVFLLSDASSYMTGANLVIDGGWTAW